MLHRPDVRASCKSALRATTQRETSEPCHCSIARPLRKRLQRRPLNKSSTTRLPSSSASETRPSGPVGTHPGRSACHAAIRTPGARSAMYATCGRRPTRSGGTVGRARSRSSASSAYAATRARTSSDPVLASSSSTVELATLVRLVVAHRPGPAGHLDSDAPHRTEHHVAAPATQVNGHLALPHQTLVTQARARVIGCHDCVVVRQ